MLKLWFSRILEFWNSKFQNLEIYFQEMEILKCSSFYYYLKAYSLCKWHDLFKICHCFCVMALEITLAYWLWPLQASGIAFIACVIHQCLLGSISYKLQIHLLSHQNLIKIPPLSMSPVVWMSLKGYNWSHWAVVPTFHLRKKYIMLPNQNKVISERFEQRLGLQRIIKTIEI